MIEWAVVVALCELYSGMDLLGWELLVVFLGTRLGGTVHMAFLRLGDSASIDGMDQCNLRCMEFEPTP